MNTTQITHNDETLFDKIVQMDETINGLVINKASTDYDGFIGSAYEQLELTPANGSFSITSEAGFNSLGLYFISINYTNGNTLVDRTFYALRVNTNSVLQNTIQLVGGTKGNDSLLVTYRNNQFTFATTYTGTASGCKVNIL